MCSRGCQETRSDIHSMAGCELGAATADFQGYLLSLVLLGPMRQWPILQLRNLPDLGLQLPILWQFKKLLPLWQGQLALQESCYGGAVQRLEGFLQRQYIAVKMQAERTTGNGTHCGSK